MRFDRLHFLLAGCLLILLSQTDTFRSYKKAFLTKKPPQLILVLGGDVDREHVGAKLASKLNLPLILSGGSNPEHARWLVKQSAIPEKQVILDYRAQDTLSNFTSLIDEIQDQGIEHSLIVTSKDHLSRAMAVGIVIAGSRGVRLTSIGVPCRPNCIDESIGKKVFDLLRAVAWVATEKDLKMIASKHFYSKAETNALLQKFFNTTPKDPSQALN